MTHVGRASAVSCLLFWVFNSGFNVESEGTSNTKEQKEGGTSLDASALLSQSEFL